MFVCLSVYLCVCVWVCVCVCVCVSNIREIMPFEIHVELKIDEQQQSSYNVYNYYVHIATYN